MRLTIMLVFLLCLVDTVNGQSINCNELHAYIDSLHATYTIYMDESPKLLSGGDLAVNNSFRKGVVYVGFIINKKGNPTCLKVSKSTEHRLNERAFEVIRKLEYTPAKQKGKAIFSKMTLPITFQ